MPFKEVIAAGVYLVREALRSPNFVTGQQGWTINRDGSAEFSNVLVRGTVIVGSIPGSAVEIIVNQNTNRAEINFYSGGALETDPGDIGAQVSNSPTANQPMLFITSNEMGFDSVDLRLGAPTNAGEYGFYFINNSTSGTNGVVQIDGDLNTRLGNNTNLASIAGTTAGFQIGANGVVNMAFGGQLIQTRNNGVAIPLALNIFGGGVVMGDTTGAGRGISISSNDIQAIFGGAGSVLQLNPNGSQVFVQGTTNSAGGFLSTGGSASLNGSSFGAGITLAGGTQIGTVIILAGGDFNTLQNPNTTGAGTQANFLNTGGTAWQLRRFTSSRRYKENISDLTSEAHAILALAPRIFKRNDETRTVPVPSTSGMIEDEYTTLRVPVDESPWRVGFVAEEAEELGLEHWLDRDADGTVQGFQYNLWTVAQQIVLREQQARIDKLEALVASLTKE